jgi:hypothetical protein
MKVDVENIRRPHIPDSLPFRDATSKIASQGEPAVYYLVYMQVTTDVFALDFRLRSPRCHVYSYANNSVVATVGIFSAREAGKALA